MNLIELPINGTVFKTRAGVPLLNAKYDSYKTALNQLVSDWLDGKTGTEAPSEEWEGELLKTVNEAVNKSENAAEDRDDEECRDVYDKLIEIKAIRHLQIATSHRNWLRKTFQALSMVGVKLSKKVEHLLRIHDLSKYTHYEVLGYAIRFGVGQLNSDKEQREWDLALSHHLSVNPHHPEYFIPTSGDVTKDRSEGGLLELNVDKAEDYLVESLIDMLACRGERQLAGDDEFSLSKWLDIEVKFMDRYSLKDKEFVVQLLEEWKYSVRSVDNQMLDRLNGHFDIRPVVN